MFQRLMVFVNRVMTIFDAQTSAVRIMSASTILTVPTNVCSYLNSLIVLTLQFMAIPLLVVSSVHKETNSKIIISIALFIYYVSKIIIPIALFIYYVSAV